jgi:hypothetical protein
VWQAGALWLQVRERQKQRQDNPHDFAGVLDGEE